MLTGQPWPVNSSFLFLNTLAMKQTIITKTAMKPGKTIAIFGGVHGNEKIGVMLIDKLIKSFEPHNGTVHFVYGNPRAIEQNMRFTETNLNRNFIKIQNPISYEEQRAQELMELLDTCDGLLDLHSYNEPDMQIPTFAICEKGSFPAVKQLPITSVLSGFNDVQKGSSNGYMEEHNKVGIVIELGSIMNPERYMDTAQACVMNFLQHFGVIKKDITDGQEQTFLEVANVHRRKNEAFKFKKKYVSFDTVKSGEVIATDGPLNLQAMSNGKILFPRYDSPIGAESFWILEEI